MAAGSTFTPIATTTLSSATTSYTFSSIPSTYTDIILVYQTRASSQNVYIDVICQVNSDTGTNYSHTYLSGNGSTINSGRSTNQAKMFFDANGAPWNAYWGAGQAHFMNYANTSTYKTVISRSAQAGGTSGGVDAVVNLWRSTSAINSIKVYLNGAYDLDAGSTFTLYGITAA